MATMVPPQKNIEYIFYVGLVSQADTKLLQNNPTLAAGDVLVSTDGGATSNLDTLPAVTPASSDMVKVTVSATEMNGDNVIIVFSDVAGSEWCDLIINIQTSAQSLDATDIVADAIKTVTDVESGVKAAVVTVDGIVDDILVDTGTTLPATLATIAAYIDTEVAAIITDLDNATDGLGALKALIDALQTQVDTTGVALLASAVDAVWDEALTGASHNVATSAGRRLRQLEDATLIREGTCQVSAVSTVVLDEGASAVDGFYDHCIVVLTSGTGAYQARCMDDYIGATKTGTVHPDWKTAPDATSTYTLYTFVEVHVHQIQGTALAEINAEVDTALTDYDPPTNTEMNTGHGLLATVAKQNVIDGIVDAILTDTGTTLPATLATIAGYLDTEVAAILAAVDTEVAAIKAKTDNLPSGIQKNVAYDYCLFLMRLSSDHSTPATGKSITAQVSKDGGAFVTCTNSVSEISNGIYKINLTQTEMNADSVILKFTETDCDTTFKELKPSV